MTVERDDSGLLMQIVPAGQRVQVVLGGEMVADTTAAMLLLEKGLPGRYYIPREDVRMELLEPSDKATRCPHKGDACYWNATIGPRNFGAIVWSYPEPVAGAEAIRDMMCFYAERVDAIYVDGAPLAQSGA